MKMDTIENVCFFFVFYILIIFALQRSFCVQVKKVKKNLYFNHFYIIKELLA